MVSIPSASVRSRLKAWREGPNGLCDSEISWAARQGNGEGLVVVLGQPAAVTPLMAF